MATSSSPLKQSQSTGGFLATASPKIPEWLSTKTLSKRRYRLAGTGNTHGLEAQEYLENLFPLPKMFGDENYSFSLVDIEDPRYIEECASMSRKLIHYYGDQQIMDIEWKKLYRELTTHETRFHALPLSASQKTRDALKEAVVTTKKKLLELQQQKDLYQEKVQEIYDRCATIKASIKKENDLDQLREEMTNATRAKFGPEDEFWSTSFHVGSAAADEDDPLAHLDEFEP